MSVDMIILVTRKLRAMNYARYPILKRTLSIKEAGGQGQYLQIYTEIQ